MEKYIKTFVYSTIVLTVLAFYFLNLFADNLESIEYEAYYKSIYEENEDNRDQVSFEYLDSLGGNKISWLWGIPYSYPEMLDWNIYLGLRSEEGLEGEFSWQPDYKQMLLNLSNQKNDRFLIKSLDAAPKLQPTESFFAAWKFLWEENGNLALKDFFPICEGANDNTEAFNILRNKLLDYLPKAQIILEERLKNAEIEASTFWAEGHWEIEILTKGWLNRKAFKLLMESKGELNIHDFSYNDNLEQRLLLYDRYLNQENDEVDLPITEALSSSILRGLPNGPILRHLQSSDYSNYFSLPAFDVSFKTFNDSIQQAITQFLEDNLASKFLPSNSFFAWTKSFDESIFYEKKIHLLALKDSALLVNGHINPASIHKAEKNEFDEVYYDVFFQFNTDKETEDWKNKTIQNWERKVAFVLDGEIIFIPQINQYILDGRVVLFDGFSKATAHSLASLISSPTLYIKGELEAQKWGITESFQEIDYEQICFLSLSIGLGLGTIILFFQITFSWIRRRNQP